MTTALCRGLLVFLQLEQVNITNSVRRNASIFFCCPRAVKAGMVRVCRHTRPISECLSSGASTDLYIL